MGGEAQIVGQKLLVYIVSGSDARAKNLVGKVKMTQKDKNDK